MNGSSEESDVQISKNSYQNKKQRNESGSLKVGRFIIAKGGLNSINLMFLDEEECPFIVGKILKIIDSERTLIQIYTNCNKKVKYGMGKFDKWYLGGPPDRFLEEIIEKASFVNDFANLKKGKIPNEILRVLMKMKQSTGE